MNAPPIKLTPLYTQTRNYNAQFGDLAGWQVPDSYGYREAQVTATSQGLALADDSPNGKIILEGQQASAVLQAAFVAELTGAQAQVPDIGLGVSLDSVYLFRLRQDQFFISTPPGAEGGMMERLAPAGHAARHQGGRPLVAVQDATQGRSEIRVIGPASGDFLSKLCGLDFYPTAFPNLGIRQSSLAKTAQIIIRRDLVIHDLVAVPAFSVIGPRSLAAYLWRIMLEAGAEWRIAPVGRAALEELDRAQV